MKKAIMRLGTLAATVTPIVAVVSCGPEEPNTKWDGQGQTPTHGTSTTTTGGSQTSGTTGGSGTQGTGTSGTLSGGTPGNVTPIVTPTTNPPATNPPLTSGSGGIGTITPVINNGLTKVVINSDNSKDKQPTLSTTNDGEAGFSLTNFISSKMMITASIGSISNNDKVTGLTSRQAVLITVKLNNGETWADGSNSDVVYTIHAPVQNWGGLPRVTLSADNSKDVPPRTTTSNDGEVGFTFTNFDISKMTVSSSVGLVDVQNGKVTGLTSGQAVEITVTPMVGQLWAGGSYAPISFNLVAPTKAATPVILTATTLQRGVQGTWTGLHSYNVVLGDGNGVPEGTTINVDTYETPMFKYHVDTNGYPGFSNTDKITKTDIEFMAKEFEKNVNYGMGAYVRFNNTTRKYELIDKPEIEFICGSGGISWGGTTGSEITLASTAPTNLWDKHNWIYTIIGVMLHEYGHHETLVDTELLFGRDGNALNGLRDHLDPKFIANWGDNGLAGVGGPDFGTTTQAYATPFGVQMPSGYTMYSKPSYNWKGMEFATRVQQLIEENFPINEVIGLGTPSLGDQDLAGLYNTFGGDSPIEAAHINQTIDAYKNYVYGFNKTVQTDFNDLIFGLAIDDAHKADTVEASFELDWISISSYGFGDDQKAVIKNWIGEANYNSLFSETTRALKVFLRTHTNFLHASIPLVAKPAQFRFNTDYTNTTPEEVVNGYVLMPQLNKQTRAFMDALQMFKDYDWHLWSSPTFVAKKAGSVVTFAN